MAVGCATRSAMTKRYFEDFAVGDIIELGKREVTAEAIVAFAREFDPQPFHVDPEAAKQSACGGLVASGWHTAGLFMRLFVDAVLSNADSMGSPGVDELRWTKPVRPGDVVSGRLTVTEARASASRPDRGIIRSDCELFNQDGELVMTLKGVTMLGRRPA